MAGSGHRTFVAGETLTAANMNGSLMDQAVTVHGITGPPPGPEVSSPAEGMLAYTSTDEAYWWYTGAAWQRFGPKYDTWVPQLWIAGASRGIDDGSGGDPKGTYIQVGQHVHIMWNFKSTGAVGGSSDMEIRNLPYDSADSELAYGMMVFTEDATSTKELYLVNGSSSTVLVFGSTTGTGGNLAAPLADNDGLRGYCIYQTTDTGA